MAANPLIGSFDASAQAVDLVPVTPNDGADLAFVARAIRCKPTGAAGTLRFTAYSGQVRNTDIAVGEVLLVFAKRIHQSGTTATGLEVYI